MKLVMLFTSGYAGFLLLFGLSLISSVQSQPGFYSIDCGAAKTTTYVDGTETNNIVWTPDTLANMSQGTPITVAGSGSFPTRYQTARFFPDTTNYTKYCYSLSPVQAGGVYIVRASFYLGTTTGIYSSSQVSFNFIIDSYVATTVNITIPQVAIVSKEVYVKANSTNLYACVAPGDDAPFVSAIELRPTSLYEYGGMAVSLFNYPLVLLGRANLAESTTPNIRYPDDKYDRIWETMSGDKMISTTNNISTSNLLDSAPEKVLQTAWAPTSSFGKYNYIYWKTDDEAEHLYLLVFYFAEINGTVNKEGMRVFDVGVNNTGKGTTELATVDIFKLAGGQFTQYALFNITRASGTWINTTFSPLASSTLPPIISGFEIIRFLDFVIPLDTTPNDVFAVESFISSLSSQLSGYTGDPCLPIGFGFPWLNCSYESITQVIGIDLSNKGLTGEVPSSLNSLTQLIKISLSNNNFVGTIPNLGSLVNLEELDLSNNQLSGSIPTFLTKLPNLKVLNLENNNLSGPIPSELLQSKGLNFKYSGNANLNSTMTVSSSSSRSSSHTIPIIVGVVIGIVVLVIIILTIVICKCRSKKTVGYAKPSPSVDLLDTQDVVQKAIIFSYMDIKTSTQNFAQLLGRGGFGEVYKGKIKDGRDVAIKVLSINESQGQGVHEFKNEASLLSTVHHRNIVQLIGYCTDQKLALVYELMPKGSLFNALFGSNLHLNWIQRLTIMVDVAQGLEYLHHQCVKQIIHRDIKSTNILLDNNFHGKIADLGISKDNNATTRLMGSFGYLDPEYAQTSLLTTMVDIYSFGVVLLEVITGKPPMMRTNDERDIRLVDWVKPLVDNANLEELVDNRLTYNEDAMWNVLDVAIRCTRFHSFERPKKMGEIVNCLADALQTESRANHSEHVFGGTSSFPQTEVLAR